MNPLLRDIRILTHVSKKTLRLVTTDGKALSFRPCGASCICLLYLDLKDFKSRNYYKQCFRTKSKD